MKKIFAYLGISAIALFGAQVAEQPKAAQAADFCFTGWILTNESQDLNGTWTREYHCTALGMSMQCFQDPGQSEICNDPYLVN